MWRAARVQNVCVVSSAAAAAERCRAGLWWPNCNGWMDGPEGGRAFETRVGAIPPTTMLRDAKSNPTGNCDSGVLCHGLALACRQAVVGHRAAIATTGCELLLAVQLSSGHHTPPIEETCFSNILLVFLYSSFSEIFQTLKDLNIGKDSNTFRRGKQAQYPVATPHARALNPIIKKN